MFIMIYVSFDMILGAYLIGNMTALIVKGSKTEKFRDKMTDLMKYINRNRLGRDIRDQIIGHLRLQYESSYTEASVLQDIPISIRAKVIYSQELTLNVLYSLFSLLLLLIRKKKIKGMQSDSSRDEARMPNYLF